MPTTFSKSSLVKSIRVGIEKAFSAYYLGASEWLDNAPEYFATSHIFLAINKPGNVGYITLEEQIRESLKKAAATQRGRRHKTLAGMKRFDIVVWNQYESPRVAIEVKSPVYSFEKKVKNDIERLKKTLRQNKKNSSFKYGVLAMYSSIGIPKRNYKTAREALNAKMNTFEGEFRKLDDDDIKVSFAHGPIRKVDGGGRLGSPLLGGFGCLASSRMPSVLLIDANSFERV